MESKAWWQLFELLDDVELAARLLGQEAQVLAFLSPAEGDIVVGMRFAHGQQIGRTQQKGPQLAGQPLPGLGDAFELPGELLRLVGLADSQERLEEPLAVDR